MHRFTNCSLCSLVYAAREAGRNSRRPLLLDCGHTFCEACLNHLVKDQKGLIACPTCQAEICLQFFESNTKSLCQDIYMTGMIILEQKNVLEKQFNKTFKRRNSSHEKTIKKVKCAECCSNRAACRCMQCNVPLCRICFAKVHSSSVTLKMHQSITLNEDVVKSEDEEMEPAICKLHSNRPLEYYCEEDSALICSRCALLGDHKGHSITAIEEKNRSTLIEIENAMQTAVIVAKKLRRTDKVLSTSSPDICEESFTLVQEIHAHFHHLHGQLQVRERRLIEKAYEMFRFSLPQEDMHSVVREQLKELEAAIKAGQRLLNQSSEPAVNATRICNKLQGSYKIPCCLTLDDTVTDDCSFRFEPGELLTEKINCYGDIVGSPKSKYILYTLSEISEELLDEDVDTLSSVSYTSENNQLFAEDVFEEKIDSDMRSLKAESDDADRKQVLCRPHLLRRKNLGHNERVVVTHIKNPCQFMIQKCADFIAIQNLSKQINSWCIANKNLAQHLVTSVEVGDYVLAQYSQDNTWYRACVKTVLPRMTVDCDGDGQNTESVEVFYVDYGNSEIQTLDRLLKIQKRYMKNSGFAYECSLYDITSALEDGTWSPETLQLFAKMTSKKPLLMMVIKEIHNVYHVDLSKPPDSYIRDDRPVSVRDALIFLEHAKFITAASAPLLGGPKLIPSRSYPKSEPRRVGEVLDVITTYLNGPDDFFVQKLGEEYLYLSNLMAKMQKQYNTGNNDLWAMYCPQKDMICSCLCEEDGYWYRVKVIGLPGHQQVEVCFVDFGMVSHVSYTSLRKLLDEFLILPVQAIHCRLADVEPLDGTQGWCEEANNWLKKRLQLQQHTVKVVGVGGSYIAVVAYESSMQSSLNHQLVKKGFAKSTGKWSEKVETLEKQCVPLKNNSSSSRCEANMKKEASSEVPPPGTQTNQQVVAVNAQDEKEPLVEVKLSHFESPAKFFVQVMLDLKKLDSLLEELAAEYAESEPSWVTWELGTYCAVKCPETDQWYRAKISQVILKELIEVYLVDFGNTFQVSTTSLRPLKEQFSILPRFAITCHLASYTPAGGKKEWTQTACEFIQEELRNKKYFIIKRGDVTDGSLPVDLLIEDEIPETALEPSSKIYSSLGKKIQEQGLAIPLRRKNSMLKETSDGADGSVKAQSSSFQAAASVWKPHPIPSSSITYVVPSYIDDTGIIYAMEYSEGEDALQALSDKIKLHYKNTSRPPDDYQWTVGKSCLGYFEADQVWARATVKRIIGDKIEVHYIDYGNSQLLPADKLRADVHHVIDVPPLTLTLVLDVVPKSVDGKWPKEVIQYIHDAIVGNVCAVQVVRVPKVGAVEVKLVVGEDRELGISLCKMGNACHKQNMLHLAEQSQKICQTLKHSNPYKLLHLPEIGEYFPVLITHIELPNIVYFQNAHTPKEDSWSQVVNAQLTELEQLSVELNTFGPNAAILKDLQPGQICCAQFTFDHCWYRGLVISCDIMNEALVLYVDYGTSEYVSLDKIKKLSPEFQDLPAQAMHCMLYALHPPENAKIWSIQAMNCIIETTTNKELVACIKDKSTPPSIELYSSVPALSDNSVVYKPLVDKGLACFHEPPNCKLEQTANHCAPVEAENEGNVAEPGLMVDAGNAGCQMNKAKIDLEEIDGSLG